MGDLATLIQGQIDSFSGANFVSVRLIFGLRA